VELGLHEPIEQIQPIRDRRGRLRASPVMQTMTIYRPDHLITSGFTLARQAEAHLRIDGMMAPFLSRAERSTPEAHRSALARGVDGECAR
jgi:hypothetical protein